MVGDLTGVVLAGGRGQRMSGADKGLIPLGDAPMIAHVVDRLRPQVDEVVIVANRNQTHYGHYADRVVPDRLPGYLGPLGGVDAGLRAARGEHAVFVPCDAPALPLGLAQRLQAAGSSASVAHDGRRRQPAFSLMAVHLAAELERALEAGTRALQAWLERIGAVEVDCTDLREGFCNINTAAELARYLGDAPPQNR